MKYCIAFLLLHFCLLNTGCKKYPQDEGLSLKTPESRLLGKWKPVKFALNDLEQSTSVLSVYFPYSYIEFKDQGSYQEFSQDGQLRFLGQWQLQDGKKKLYTFGTFSIGTTTTVTLNRTWVIEKLTKKNLTVTLLQEDGMNEKKWKLELDNIQ